MPIYTFKNNTGDTVEELVPLGTTTIKLDGVDYKKCDTPHGVAFTGNAVGMPSQAEQVRQGYHKLEQTLGSRFLDRSKFTTKQIKKAWGF
tara:strand:+ start:6558 stop:6827 length:270 start_codon:yes stop_codon:yes gene_type:complete